MTEETWDPDVARRVIHEDFVGAVEGTVIAGEFEKIEAEVVRAQRLRGEPDGVGKLGQPAGERGFLREIGRAHV